VKKCYDTLTNILLITFLSVFLLISCSKIKSPKTQVASKESDNKIELVINGNKIRVELAKTLEERALGLMFRKLMDWDSGMLFIFEEEGFYPFWMKFTHLPLSIAYINRDDIIIDIIEMVPNQEEIRYSPSVPYIVALEMNQGWFIEHSVNIGDTIYGIPQ
jgi:uncharacterized membrane protein (UPF0127 family)